MAIYSFTALKNNKDIVKGKVEAQSLKEARASIRNMGFIPTKVTEDKLHGSAAAAAAKELKSIKAAPLKKLNLQERIDFTSTMQILAQSGIPIIESLMFIENDADRKSVRKVAHELRKQIMAGATFAETISRYRQQFGQVYVGLVKAGEDAGELETTLERLLELQQKEAAVKSKVVGTLMYPAFTICIAIIITLVMLVFVFPAFKDMFDSMGQELPWITATLMNAGLFLQKYWFMSPLSFASIVGLVTFLFTWEVSRRKIDLAVLKIPLLREFVQFANYSNFMAVLQVAYDAGVPIVESLYLSNLTLTNYTLREKIEEASGHVAQGQHLSVALRATEVVPRMLLFMIATGEQSGRLGAMLMQATKYIDTKLDNIIDTMTKLIEPLMLIVVGGIVLILALALYLPLFQSYLLD
jgi:type IV pilus assembly protein PilC